MTPVGTFRVMHIRMNTHYFQHCLSFSGFFYIPFIQIKENYYTY